MITEDEDDLFRAFLGKKSKRILKKIGSVSETALADNIIFSQGELLEKGYPLFIEIKLWDQKNLKYKDNIVNTRQFPPIFTDFTAVKNMRIF